MGKAVQDFFPAAELRDRFAVVFLVEEKTGFLPVFKVHAVFDSVFKNRCFCGFRLRQSGDRIKAFVLLHAFQFADRNIVSLVNAVDGLPVFRKDFVKQRKENRLQLFHSKGKRLCYQNVVETIHRKPGKLIRFTENYAAAGQIVPHNRFAVVPGVPQAALEKGFVENIVRVSGKQANPGFWNGR